MAGRATDQQPVTPTPATAGPGEAVAESARPGPDKRIPTPAAIPGQGARAKAKQKTKARSKKKAAKKAVRKAGKKAAKKSPKKSAKRPKAKKKR